MNTANVGIIGYGKMGRLRETIINHNNSLNLKGIYDIKSKDISKDLCYLDVNKLYSDIDIAFIAVPHSYTKKYVVNALNCGLNVFSEKPPGISVKEIQAMMIAEIISNKKLKFGFNHRYHDAIIKAYEIIESTELGKIIWIRGVYGRRDSGGGWRNDPEMAGSGILLSQGIHMIDIFRLYMGEIDEVKSFVSKNNGMETNVFAILRNKDNQTASLHSSALMEKHTFSIDIGLEKGYISINNILTESRSFGGYETLTFGLSNTGIRGNPIQHTYVYNKDNSWKNEISDFVEDIHYDRKVKWGSSLDALNNMKLVEQIYNDDTH